MRVEVDFTLCEAHGQCTLVAPELFELDDDDAVVTIRNHDPDEQLRNKAHAAVDACPVAAISLKN